MRKICQILVFLICSIGVKAQTDTIKKPTFWLRPYGEIGITFLNNDILKQAYSTNTSLRWGIGLRAGNPMSNNVLVNIKYNIMSIHREYIDNQSIKLDSMLEFQDINLSFDIVVKRTHSNFIRISPGLISSKITDDVNDNYGKGYGLQIGIGYEGSLFKNSRVYIGYTYSYVKLESSPEADINDKFDDYDTQNLTIGFIL